MTDAARAAFVARLFASAQAQLDDITRRLGERRRSGAEAERDARATAALVKVLCALDGEAGGNGNDEAPDDDDNPRDLEDFRRELARRLDDIVAGRNERAAGGTDLA